MNLSHRLLSSVVLAGAVFSVTALPLVTLGSKPVTVQLEERPVFVGQLRELAAPYLALATGVSLGIGVVSLAVSSWRHAAYKLERNEAEIATLKQQLDEKNALIERLRFADTKLQSSGLEQFLQVEELVAPLSHNSSMHPSTLPSRSPTASTSSTIPASNYQVASIHQTTSGSGRSPIPQPKIPQTLPNFHHAAGNSSKFSTAGLAFFLDDETESSQLPEDTQLLEDTSTQSVPSIAPDSAQVPTPANRMGAFITEPAKIQAVSSLPAAQPFKGFVRSESASETASMGRSQPIHPSEQSTQLNELLGHLKHVMTQIERLQTNQSPGHRKGL